MRTGSTQSVPTGSPFITAIVYGDTYNTEGAGSNERILGVTTDEQLLGGQYIILLDNSDEALNAKDYEGRPLTLKMGFTGETQSQFHPLWVWTQEAISIDGRLVLRLNCVDIWVLISYVDTTLTNASYNQTWQLETELSSRAMADGTTLWSEGDPTAYAILVANGNKTVLEIVQALCTAAGVGYDAGDEDSYLSLKPPMSISNIRTGLWQAMDYTESFLKLKSNGNLSSFKPSLHSTVYTFNHINTFNIDVDEAGVTIPNRIYFWSFNEDGDEWIYGSAADSDSYARLGNKYVDRHYMVAGIDNFNKRNVTELNSYAAGALAKIQAERNQGIVVAPMHCSLELLDKIQVNDDRYTSGGDRVVTGYVHRIVREYDRGVYRITISLGGTSSGYTPPGGTPGNGMQGGEAPDQPTPTPDWTLPPWDEILPKAVQGYTHNITFSSTDYNTIAWTAGTIKFYDGTTQAILAGNTGNLGTSSIYNIYFNLTDASPNVLKVCLATDYMSTYLTEYTGILCVCQRATDTDGNATFLPSYGKEPFITTDMINMAGMKSWTDPETGAVYESVLETEISSGYLKLTANTKYESDLYNPSLKKRIIEQSAAPTGSYDYLWWDTDVGVMYRWNGSDWIAMNGEWYNKTGVLMDATKGIRIYGTDMAFATFANVTDARGGTNYQCKMDTTGSLIAGAGAIKLNATGLHVYVTSDPAPGAQRLNVYYGGNLKGYITCLGGGLLVKGDGTNELVLVGDGLQASISHSGFGIPIVYNAFPSSPTEGSVLYAGNGSQEGELLIYTSPRGGTLGWWRINLTGPVTW